jgi:hypothetical protein
LPSRNLRSPAEADRLEAFGEQLTFIAQSVFLPDGDLAVAVHPPNYDNHVEFRSIPLQAGTLMFAELLRHDDNWRGMKEKFDVQLVPERRVLRSQGSELLMTAASMAAVQAWVERDLIKVRDLMWPRNAFLAEDLRRGAAERIHEIVNSHPDLGDRYVAIRSEVFRQQADILAPFRKAPQAPPTAR